MSQLGCGPQANNIQDLVNQTSINFTNSRDLGNASELQAALIWAQSNVDVTDLVSCIGKGAAFFLFPERVMKMPSQCFPKEIKLMTRTSSVGTTCTPTANTGEIFYGYREGLNNGINSYSSIFYIGGPNPPVVPFKVPGATNPRLVSDWTGIAFSNLVFSDGVLYYHEPNSSPSSMVGFKITVYSNEQFRSRAMTPNEVAVLTELRPDLLFTQNDGQVYTYIKSPFQDMGGDGEFWWSPARFRIMQQIVQAAYMRDEHKLSALRHANALNSRSSNTVKLTMRHYSSTLAKSTLLTGYNPELAIMGQLEVLVSGVINQYPQVTGHGLHLLKSARFQCSGNKPYIILDINPTAHSIILTCDGMLTQITRTDDVGLPGKSILNP